jgi:hypothetical protein
MLPEPISSSFLAEKASLSLSDLRWAIDNGIIGAQTVVDGARTLLAEDDKDPLVLELAALGPEELSSVTNLLQRVPVPEQAEADIRRKWVWLVLLWLYDRHHNEPDVLEAVESLYADLGYPDEMASFGPYAPAYQVRRDPNEQRDEVMSQWRKYLKDGAESFGRR